MKWWSSGKRPSSVEQALSFCCSLILFKVKWSVPTLLGREGRGSQLYLPQGHGYLLITKIAHGHYKKYCVHLHMCTSLCITNTWSTKQMILDFRPRCQMRTHILNASTPDFLKWQKNHSKWEQMPAAGQKLWRISRSQNAERRQIRRETPNALRQKNTVRKNIFKENQTLSKIIKIHNIISASPKSKTFSIQKFFAKFCTDSIAAKPDLNWCEAIFRLYLT